MQLRIWICVLLASCVFAENGETRVRSTKRPFIADAVGNTIPPPSAGPSPVGSPSNLLTPDRYEFYTFDESGELVKRLMTLEEIQAIVAAGEGNEGHLVTLSNDDQPTMAFNFSQPPFTKVHNVVTNVQNVLKAQMEAQKKNPPSPASFDTPDVSESWSLILPSIFGNTGVDIVPDKSSSSITTPETETIDIKRPALTIIENSLSKEGSNHILPNTETTFAPEIKYTTTEKVTTRRIVTSSSTNGVTPRFTTTQRPRITTIINTNPSTMASKITTMELKPTTFSQTPNIAPKPTTLALKLTTIAPKPSTLALKSTTVAPKLTTIAPKSTTIAPKLTTIIPKITTTKIKQTKKPQIHINSQISNDNIFKKNEQSTKTNLISTTEKINTIKFERISTVPTPQSSTFEQTYEKYTDKVDIEKPLESTSTTKKYISTTITENPKITQPPVTTYKPIQFTISNIEEGEKSSNTTTLTTQSVSPSTTISTTQFMKVENIGISNESNDEIDNNRLTNDKPLLSPRPDIPIFDVAQSISQIASDLGNNFPNPTTSTLLETTKLSSTMDLESKENIEIDIPIDLKNESITITETPSIKLDDDKDTFIKVSTINPSSKPSDAVTEAKRIANVTTVKNILSDKSSGTGSTIDPILSESMDDLLSQVVNQAPLITTTTIKDNVKEISFVTNKPAVTSAITLGENINETYFIPNINNRININNNKNENIKQNKFEGTGLLNNITIENSGHINKNNEYVQISTNNLTDILKENDTHNGLKDETKDFIEIESITEKTNIIVDNNSGIKDNIQINNNTYSNYNLDTNSVISKQDVLSNIPVKKTNGNDSKAVNEENRFTNINNLTNTKFTIHHKISTLPDILPKDDIKKKIQKINIDDKELLPNNRNNSWKLISTVSPPKSNDFPKDKIKVDNHVSFENNDHHKQIILDVSKENQGLEVTTNDLAEDIYQFTELCNELAFRYWNTVVENIDKKRTFVLSPYSITSMLAMMFMGARGATSGEMNEILKLDDMVTFNPHFTLKNISDSIETSSNSGVAVSAFIRELYSDKDRGKILTFYKERAQHFYNGHVEEVNFKAVNDIIRRRTNLLIKRFTWGKIGEYLKSNSISVQPPLAAISANIFETDCSGSSVDGRDGEMYFVVSPNVRQRRLVPVPAVVYKKGFLAGYDPVLDATAAALGTTNDVVSTLFLMPGQQGNIVHGEDLEALERRFLSSNPTTPTWNRLLRTLLPRIGLEVQIPRFAHKSTFNISSTLKQMGLKDLFDPLTADLGGVNGPTKDLYLSDMVQITTFATCGEGVIGEQHHVEEYPETLEGFRRRRTSRWASGWDEPRDYQRAFHDPHDVGDAMHLPLHLRPRQARLPSRSAQPARLKFDRPFLYFVRHNPSGMILYVGRYNPRLLP